MAGNLLAEVRRGRATWNRFAQPCDRGMHCIAYTGVRTEPRPNHELRVICGGGARVPSVAQGMMPSQRRSGGWAKVGAVSQPELARRQGETGGGRARVSSATMTARISLSSNAALPRTPGWEPHPHDSRCDAAMQRCRAPVNSMLGSRVRLKKILFFFSFLFFSFSVTSNSAARDREVGKQKGSEKTGRTNSEIRQYFCLGD